MNDGTDEYIAEKGSYNWEREPHRTCESGFEECLNVCADGDESCADNCASSFNCETTYTCDTLAPDGSCGIQGADQDFGGHKLNLNFDPGPGQLNNFMNYLDSQSIGVTTQSGFLSEEVFRA